jgi:hypothetical protein
MSYFPAITNQSGTDHVRVFLQPKVDAGWGELRGLGLLAPLESKTFAMNRATRLIFEAGGESEATLTVLNPSPLADLNLSEQTRTKKSAAWSDPTRGPCVHRKSNEGEKSVNVFVSPNRRAVLHQT